MISPHEQLGMEASFVAYLQQQHPELMPHTTADKFEVADATTTLKRRWTSDAGTSGPNPHRAFLRPNPQAW